MKWLSARLHNERGQSAIMAHLWPIARGRYVQAIGIVLTTCESLRIALKAEKHWIEKSIEFLVYLTITKEVLNFVLFSLNMSSESTKVQPKSELVTTTSNDIIETIEDQPPSYALAMFRQTVEQTIKNQKQMKQNGIVANQPPGSSSPHLSKHSSLGSTELILSAETIRNDRLFARRPRSQAWSETVVIRNLHERDRMSILCFCGTTLTTVFTLAFYCSA